MLIVFFSFLKMILNSYKHCYLKVLKWPYFISDMAKTSQNCSEMCTEGIQAAK